ncbi:MAG: hypothetical protein V3T83_04495 [Acidobacteriota bacterium]
MLYPPSEGKSAVRFYIPTYTMRTLAGRHTSTLRLRREDEENGAPFGRLELELVAQAPVDRRFRLGEMEHEAVARIRYRIPVDSGDGPDLVPSGASDGMEGHWINVDANTRGMTQLIIDRSENGRLQMHGFGKCSPSDCDWGVVSARRLRRRNGALVGNYDFGFKKTRITARLSDGQLLARVFDDYAEGDRRSDRTTNYVMRRNAPPPPPQSAELILELGALQPVGDSISRVRRDLLSVEEYERLLQIMTQEVYQARLEIEVTATVGRRTWRQVASNILSTVAASQNVRLRRIDSVVARAETPAGESGTIGPIGPLGPLGPVGTFGLPDISRSPIRFGDQPVGTPSPASLRVMRQPTIVNRSVGFQPAFVQPAIAVEQPTGGQPAQPNVVATDLRAGPPVQPFGLIINGVDFGPGGLQTRVISQPQSALTSLTPNIVFAAARPLVIARRVFIDPNGSPAVVRTRVSDMQHIDPFVFPLPAHDYMFDLLEDPSPPHQLVRHAISQGDTTVTFYRDTGLADQIYYEPVEFRLVRHDTEPYTPSLLFGFLEVIEADGEEGGSAGTGSSHASYRVLVSFRSQPYNDPQILEKARLEFGQDVSFSALQPQQAALRLRLPVGQDGELVDTQRPEAEVSFKLGVHDEVELSEDEFVQLLNSFQGPSAQIDGVVDAVLLDGSSAEIPVVLSLRENGGSFFHRTPAAPVEGSEGTYRIGLANRLESPVQIVELPSFRLGPSARAHAVDPSLPITVGPGDSVEVDYQLTPSNFPLTDLDPPLQAVVDPDVGKIFQAISVNQGYASGSFQVSLSIDPAFFGTTPNGATEPLTGLRVEIQPHVSLDLTPEESEKRVSLRMPLLPFLLQEDAIQFTYRVVNLHAGGAGLASDYQSRVGNTPLRLTPAEASEEDGGPE